MKLIAAWMLAAGFLTLGSTQAYGFCGFYVAKAGTKLFNKASKVVMVRDENRTVISMASDYSGSAKDFAMVIPVPTVLKRKQINVGDPKVIEHLDSYTSPRLVEYRDPNPCAPILRYKKGGLPTSMRSSGGGRARPKKKPAYQVKIEAKYEVGEYDILILSAKESNGLSRWLVDNGYKIPAKARPILKSYIKRGLKFFVAKVNLKRHKKSESNFLKPLQIAYESNRFELPIRLGTVNAKGPQDLFVFALTKKGRVESVNYPTKKIPTGQEIPLYVKNEFSDFYKDMFSTLVKSDKMKAVYTEYAWDMSWCDPCAADPLSDAELRSLGVWWAKNGTNIRPGSRMMPRGAQNVFVTRLHMRYTAKSFPADLNLQVTSDKNNFQGRYVLNIPYTGKAECSALADYKKKLLKRQQQEAKNLAALTGRDVVKIRQKMKISAPGADGKSWIDDLWK